MGRAILLTLLFLLGGVIIADDINSKTEIELGTAITVFGLAFGAWAVVLGWVMFVIRREFHELRAFVREESDHRRASDQRAHEDRLAIERRITEIESAWRYGNHGANHD